MPAINDWDNRTNTIIKAARYVPKKNQMLLIKSFIAVHEKHPGYSLELYGEGKTKPELIDYVKQNNAVEYIKVNPNTTQIFEHMNNAKIYVSSSDTEGYSNALLEAMAMGVACISTDCCGSVRDLIDDGVNCFVVPVNDMSALSNALLAFMENDTLAKEMAAKASEVRIKNSKEKIVGEWISFFNSLLSQNEE